MTTTDQTTHAEMGEELRDVIELADAYGQYIASVPAAELERHPYLPGVEQAVHDARAILAALQQSPTKEGEGERLLRRSGEPPRDGEVYQAVYCVPVRWKAYSPKSEQFRIGVKGRWQQMNDYGGWENSPGGRQEMPFTEWYPHLSSIEATEGDGG